MSARQPSYPVKYEDSLKVPCIGTGGPGGGGGGGGTCLLEASGDVPLGGVAFSRLD